MTKGPLLAGPSRSCGCTAFAPSVYPAAEYRAGADDGEHDDEDEQPANESSTLRSRGPAGG